MIALLTGEALQVIDVAPGPHHHFEGGNDLRASRTVAGVSKQSQIIPLAQNQIRLGVQRGTNFAQTTIATAALQTVFVPVQVEGLQQEPFGDGFAAAGTLLGGAARSTSARFRRFGLRHVHRHHGAVRPALYLQLTLIIQIIF